VILLGEHSVVYGRPALAAGISPGAEATFEPGDAKASSSEVSLHIEPWNVDIRPNDGSDLGRAIPAACAVLPVTNGPGGVVRATIHLPGGGGLGSSAALGVAVIRAVGEAWASGPLTIEETLSAAYAWEKVFHGNPSGVDHTLAAHGGAGVFTKGEPLENVPLRAPLRILFADTGERSPTRDMVAGVARIHERKREATEKTFDAIAALVRNGALALAAHDARALGQLMDMNQALLSSLMLSTERTEDLCRAAREAGAFGAKLTGGGGGGCVIALATDEAKVLAAWDKLDAKHWVAEIR
jgi:mevalonate kinase